MRLIVWGPVLKNALADKKLKKCWSEIILKKSPFLQKCPIGFVLLIKNKIPPFDMTHTQKLISLIATVGWKDFTPEKASEILGISLIEIPQKEEILQAFHWMITAELKETISFDDLEGISRQDQVMEMILCRLELLTPYKPSLQRIYADLKDDPCLLPSFLWEGKFKTDWLDLVSPHPIQAKFLGFLYGVVVVHWLEEDDFNKTMAFLDRILKSALMSNIL